MLNGGMGRFPVSHVARLSPDGGGVIA